MNIRSVAVYSDPDHASPQVALADVSIRLSGNTAAETYLRSDLILAAAGGAGAEAIIPGYRFLSRECRLRRSLRGRRDRLVLVLRPNFGLKHASREIAAAAGVPLVPGSGLLGGLEQAIEAAGLLGYPAILKSTAGGNRANPMR